MNDLVSPQTILGIGTALVVVHVWILFYGGGNPLGSEHGDENQDDYTTVSVMLGLFGFVLAIHGVGLCRRVLIACGVWYGETPVQRVLDSFSFVPANDLTFVGGAALALAGVALRVWAIRTLGKLFTFQVGIRPDHRIVRDGPYRWVRHPAYAGSVMTLLGVSLSNAFSLGIILSVAMILVVYGLRIRNEEAALVQHFGEPYRRYMEQTKRLIPFVL
jgi:protein-S-isoprenylcysteine O-methyltransferase Ste14